MSIPYESITDAFLSKITEYEFISMEASARQATIDGYMKRAVAALDGMCRLNLLASADDKARSFNVDMADHEVDELADIISEGMLVQWMKPYTYKQENLENVLNTRDFTSYSPAELFLRITNAYAAVQQDFTNMMREYSYRHGDLTDLHL